MLILGGIYQKDFGGCKVAGIGPPTESSPRCRKVRGVFFWQPMSLSKRTRFNIFKRDGFRCLYCGKTPPENRLYFERKYGNASKVAANTEAAMLANQTAKENKRLKFLSSYAPGLEPDR
jgi:hypothetical protein